MAGAPRPRRVYAVGDIHGRHDLLERMRARIEADLAASPADDAVVVFLGDYVDRGPDPRAVIEFLASRPIADTDRVCLKGNHEALMLDFLDGEADGTLWCANGGEATLASYGVEPASGGDLAANLAKARRRLAEAMPASHREVLETLALYAEFDGTLYVHAGVRPGVPLEWQSEHDLLWIREEFHNAARPIENYVVHGHTVVREPLILPQRAAIDTGAWMTGQLTCLVVEGERRRIL